MPSTTVGAPGSIVKLTSNGSIQETVKNVPNGCRVIVRNGELANEARRLLVSLGKRCAVEVKESLAVESLWRNVSKGK